MKLKLTERNFLAGKLAFERCDTVTLKYLRVGDAQSRRTVHRSIHRPS